MSDKVPQLLSKPPVQAVAVFLAFLIVAVILHSPGFHSGMTFDSKLLINDNVGVFNAGLSEVVKIFPPRALFMASLYLDYLIGGMDPYLFRIVGAVYLAAAGTAVVFLSFLLFRIWTGEAELSPQFTAAGLFVGILFLGHPLQILTVLYIWQRSVIMVCFFYFSALAVYLSVRMGGFAHPRAGYLLVGTLFLLGILTKENMASLPVILFFAEVTLFRQGLSGAVQRLAVIALICIPATILYFIFTYSFHAPESILPQTLTDRFLSDYRSTNLSHMEILLTEVRVNFFYLYMIVAPGLSGIHFLKALEISQSLWNPPSTAVACTALALSVGIGILLIRRSPVVSFCIFYIVVTLLPEAVLIPKWLFFGYRPILAMFGVLFLLAMGLLYLVSVLGRWISPVVLKAAAICVIAGIVCLTAFQTWSEASEWDPMTFWTKAFFALPSRDVKLDTNSYSSVLVYYSYELIRRGNLAEAERIYPLVLSMSTSWIALHNLGRAMEAVGKSAQAVELYRKAIQLEPLRFEPHQNLGAVLMKNKDLNGAVEQFKIATELKPAYAKAHANLGIAFLAKGNVKEAIDALQTAIRLDGSLALVHCRLGTAYERSGDLKNALKEYTAALSINPKMVEAHYAYAKLVGNSGNSSLAAKHFESVIALAPGYLSAYDELGKIFEAASEYCKARKHFQKLYDMQPDYPDIKTKLENSVRKCEETKQMGND